MALGYCVVCDRLVAIVLRRYDIAKRRGAWYPVSHEHNGAACCGARKELP
jgi:hypothetical protein